MNNLKPILEIRGNFAEDEDDLIIRLHALLGNRWSLIAGRLPWRTGDEVKNYWSSHLKQKLRNMGIDPMTYRISDYVRTKSHLDLWHESRETETNEEPSDARSSCGQDDHEPSSLPHLNS